jgi:bacterioferritin B
MRISPELNGALNAQIGRELSSSHLYLNLAAYFDDRALKKLAAFFYQQSVEEREHALKFLHYLISVDGMATIPAIEAPKTGFQTAEEAIQSAYDGEIFITQNIHRLMEQALKEKDYPAQELLRWFVTEQVEEVATIENMLKVVQQAGERNVIMLEAYLSHK